MRAIITATVLLALSVFAQWDGTVDLDGDHHIRLGDFSVLADYWLEGSAPVNLDLVPGIGEGDIFVLAAHWLEFDPDMRIVPDVAGQSNPVQLITQAELTPGDMTTAYSNIYAAGLAIGSDPSAGTEVLVGSEVDYVISLGQQTGIAFVYVDDPGVAGHEGFTGYMSKDEITSLQYCNFLNELYAQGLVVVQNGKVYASQDTTYSTPYIETSASTTYSYISFTGSEFTTSRPTHPVVEVSWFGAKAFCDYNDFRLPTQWEWQAVADYDGSYVYGCGTTINTLKANYHSMNPLELPLPYTTPVDYYSEYGYGMRCMAGNVAEWTDWPDNTMSVIVVGGSWIGEYGDCRVTARDIVNPYSTLETLGFRVCRD